MNGDDSTDRLFRLIGLVGGTFDPVHYGHLRPVDHLAGRLGFSKTHYVLSGRPPHRDAPVASPGHRYQMLLLALQDYPHFFADDQEVRRRGPSYTLWTVRNLKHCYAGQTLCLVLGMDAYLGMHSWYRWQDVMALTNIAVLARPGTVPGEGSGTGSPDDLHTRGSGVVWFADTPEVALSATDIRRKLAAGEAVTGDTPPAVLEYIRQNQIYGVKSE